MTVFRIEHQCPQCGAPAGLEETDRLFACPFCRVRSVLTARDYFRYVLPAKRPAGRELIYAPYWRFKGFLLFSRPGGADHKYVDVNQLGIDMGALPPTLGLRAQAMKLRFAAPDMEGRFIAPSRSFAQTVEAFERRFTRGMGGEALGHAHLGDAIGLLYSPFYAANRLVDAVLDTPIGEVPEGFETAAAAAGKPDGGVGFIPALCPNCGWDLDGERDALVLGCGNCGSSWAPSAGALTRVDCDCLKSEEEGLLYLPFWQTTCAISGIELKSYADLVRVANLPKVAQPGFASRSFCFWTPAFKIRASAYLRLAQGLSLIQPQELLRPARPPGGCHHSATLPAEEAAKTLKVILSGMIKPVQRLAEILPAIGIQPTGHRLAYLPFRQDRHDYIQPQTRIAVNKNLLALSRSL